MLVEDDNNLREIYGERLMAEGYEIVSAGDGEEALAVAVKEKPDLIIADVMMPKISGFDMLDILRQSPETKDTKVIMMTALSQAEDKNRASALGADKYLVKSQVTLEDVARVVHDLIYGPDTQPVTTPPTAEAQTSDIYNSPSTTQININNSLGNEDKTMDQDQPSTPPTTNPASTPVPSTPVAPSTPPQELPTEPVVNEPVAPAPMPATPPAEAAESINQEADEVGSQIQQFADSQSVDQPEHEAPLIEPALPVTTPTVLGGGTVIQPLTDNSEAPKTDINKLYEEEMAKEGQEVEPVDQPEEPMPPVNPPTESTNSVPPAPGF